MQQGGYILHCLHNRLKQSGFDRLLKKGQTHQDENGVVHNSCIIMIVTSV